MELNTNTEGLKPISKDNPDLFKLPAKPVDYNHVLLYSKGHYQVTNHIDDLKVILAKRAGVSTYIIGELLIVEVLCDLFQKYCCENPNALAWLMRDIYNLRKELNTSTLIDGLLGKLSQTGCRNDDGTYNIYLGKPSRIILPLANNK